MLRQKLSFFFSPSLSFFFLSFSYNVKRAHGRQNAQIPSQLVVKPLAVKTKWAKNKTKKLLKTKQQISLASKKSDLMRDHKKGAVFFFFSTTKDASRSREKEEKKGMGGWMGGRGRGRGRGGVRGGVGSTDLYHLVKLHKPL